MQKLKLSLIFLTIIILLTGCYSTKNNASPKNILRNNPEADFFVMKSIVYVNAAEIDWVKELSLKEGNILGRIKKTEVKNFFTDWSATKLKTDTEIYQVEHQEDIVLAKVGNQFIPYLRQVEG